jgi:hypothetical protein
MVDPVDSIQSHAADKGFAFGGGPGAEFFEFIVIDEEVR